MEGDASKTSRRVGRISQFLPLCWAGLDAGQRGPEGLLSDSDVYKWTEAVGFALQSGDWPELRARLRTRSLGSGGGSRAERVFEYTYYAGDKAKDRMQPDITLVGAA